MAISINTNELFNSTSTLGAKKSEKAEKSYETTDFAVKESENKEKSADRVDFKTETASANVEASKSKIKNRDEAFEMMRSVKKQAVSSPENTAVVHASIAPDAALQLLT